MMGPRRPVVAMGAIVLLAGCAAQPFTPGREHPAHPEAAATADRSIGETLAIGVTESPAIGETLAIGVAKAEAASRAAKSGEADAQLYTCPMHPEIVRDEPGNCLICGMSLVPREEEAVKSEAAKTGGVESEETKSRGAKSEEKKPEAAESGEADAQLYTCPMHPEIVRDEPGNCPICGMSLVPQDEEAEEESGNAHDHH